MRLLTLAQFAVALAFTAKVIAVDCFCKNADTFAVDALMTNECCVQTQGQILDEACSYPGTLREDTFAQCCLTSEEIGSCTS